MHIRNNFWKATISLTVAERGSNFIKRGAGTALRIVRGFVRGEKRGQWCGFGDGEATIYFPPPGTNRHAGIINANLNHPPCVSYGRSSLSSSFINHLREAASLDQYRRYLRSFAFTISVARTYLGVLIFQSRTISNCIVSNAMLLPIKVAYLEEQQTRRISTITNMQFMYNFLFNMNVKHFELNLYGRVFFIILIFQILLDWRKYLRSMNTDKTACNERCR